MEKTIIINTGEMAVGNDDIIIKTLGIGSCIVVAIYDCKNMVGGMTHSFLPTRKKDNADTLDVEIKKAVKYVDEAIDIMVDEILKLGGNKDNLRAKLVGGSRMFKILSEDEEEGVGYKNIQSAVKKLDILGIPIESEVTGGTVGRIAEFNLSNGVLSVEAKV